MSRESIWLCVYPIFWLAFHWGEQAKNSQKNCLIFLISSGGSWIDGYCLNSFPFPLSRWIADPLVYSQTYWWIFLSLPTCLFAQLWWEVSRQYKSCQCYYITLHNYNYLYFWSVIVVLTVVLISINMSTKKYVICTMFLNM